jgi:hypothetical protein
VRPPGAIVHDLIGEESKYDTYERPEYGFNATTVVVSMDFGRLNYLDTAKQAFEINFYLGYLHCGLTNRAVMGR